MVAGAVLVAAVAGSLVLAFAIAARERRESTPQPAEAGMGRQFTPGEGMMCAEPVDDPEQPKEYPGPPRPYIDPARKYTATMRIYTYGDVKIELLAREAPWAVNNFVFLSCEGFYNNSFKFTRLVDTPQMKILQGGDALKNDGTGDPYGGAGFPDELDIAKREGYRRGMLAMANRGPDTNGSQFFFVIQDSVIPPNYTVFGRVIEGMDVLDRVFEVGTPDIRGDGIPARDVYVEWITIQEDPPSRPMPSPTSSGNGSGQT